MSNKPTEKIVSDDQILNGKPIISGTRITVQTVLDALSSSMTKEDIQQEYDIKIEDIQACLKYASNLIKEEKVYNFH